MNDLIGRKVGPYKIVGVLGEGGMAVVYKGFQESLGRHVAVKILRGQLAQDPEFIARFRREALAAARLSHPNILHVHDAGAADGLYYIAMDLAQGGSLRDVIARGPLPPEQAASIAAQLADALGYAHRQGLIHRDMKPSNVLMSEDGRPMIADFGIARVLNEATRLTRTGAFIGTPEYMAPEQAEGQPLDGRADLYAMGVVLYEMLTGMVPFSADTPAATLYKQVHETPPPVRRLNARVPAWMEAVVARALAKRPADRFQSGAELAAALRQVVPAAPGPMAPRVSPARQVPPTDRGKVAPAPRQGQRGGRAIVAVLAAMAVVLLAVLAGVLYVALSGGAKTPRATPQPTAPIAQAGALSPSVAILSPATGTSLSQGQEISIHSEATDDRGVVRVELWADGALVRTDASSASGGNTPFVADQRWRGDVAGSHSLLVRAYDANGQMAESAVVMIAVEQPAATPGQEATPTDAPPAPVATEPPTEQPTAPPTSPPPTAVPPTAVPPTHVPPTAVPPTKTPTPTPPPPTAECPIAVDPTLAKAWKRDIMGCAKAGPAIVWAAWAPFERAYMLWRDDTDWTYVLLWADDNSPSAGHWLTGGDSWKWDQVSFPNGRGLQPPPGLYEPIRGFGYVWFEKLGGAGSPTGWDTDPERERGFCARIQAFEQGRIVRSTKVASCAGNYNRGQEPAFSHFLLAIYDAASWEAFTP